MHGRPFVVGECSEGLDERFEGLLAGGGAVGQAEELDSGIGESPLQRGRDTNGRKKGEE